MIEWRINKQNKLQLLVIICFSPNGSEIEDCVSEPCEHGTCEENENNFTCSCMPGWTGEFCERGIRPGFKSVCVSLYFCLSLAMCVSE